MRGKFWGGVMLVVGTSIGAGMLAMPVSTANMGFVHSASYLFFSWMIMTLGALLLLEVNTYLPAGSNMVTMASQTLGPLGQGMTWVCYLLLLYTLLSAYISGASDLLHYLLQLQGINLPQVMAATVFTLVFGVVVYQGISCVDLLNRGLMLTKLGIFVLLLALILPHIKLPQLIGDADHPGISKGIMVLITSFSFASIVPTLREYFGDDIAQLRKVIIVGSFIPLCCYTAWDAALMGTISPERFHLIQHTTNTTSALITELGQSTESGWTTQFFRGFSAISILSAFLSISVGLFDFLADGCGLDKSGKHRCYLMLMTLGPPLAIVLCYPNAYLSAFRFAGMCCVMLLLLLPVLMAYRGRYAFGMAQQQHQLPGGKAMLLVLLLCSLGLLTLAFPSS